MLGKCGGPSREEIYQKDVAVSSLSGCLTLRGVVLSRQGLLLVGTVRSLELILLRAMLQLSMTFVGES